MKILIIQKTQIYIRSKTYYSDQAKVLLIKETEEEFLMTAINDIENLIIIL